MLQYRWHLAIFILGVGVTPIAAQPDPDVCIPGSSTDAGPKLPMLPNQYQMIIEASIVQENYTMQVQEFYDEPNNRAAAVFTFNGNMRHTSYDYVHMQKIETDQSTGKCTVSDITNKTINIYGFKVVNGQGHIGGVNDVFHFGSEYNESYLGYEMIRGIPANHWQSCFYQPEMNRTFLVDYYFSVPDYPMPNGEDEVPLRAVINGTGANVRFNRYVEVPASSKHNFYHIYDFFDVRTGPVMHDTVFEPPRGFVCVGRKSSKPVPDIPEHFEMDVESVHVAHKSIHFYKEYYHYTANLVAYVMKARKRHSCGGDLTKVVHDYNAGLSFTIDLATSKCRVSPIPIWSRDAIVNPDMKHVALRTSNSIFFHDNLTLVYEGITNVRNIESDTWIATKTDWPEWNHNPEQVNSTFEYFFSQGNWTADGGLEGNDRHIPTRREIKFEALMNGTFYHWHLIQNVFHFTSSPPEGWVFDVSECYASEQRKELAFDFEDKCLYNRYIANNSRSFERDMHVAIADAAKVPASRIANIFFEEGSNHTLTLWFTLLERPALEGDVVNPIQQISLAQAYNNLDIAINGGDEPFQVMIHHGEQMVHLNIEQGSLRDDFQSAVQANAGLSAGAVTGLYFGIILLGMLIVCVSMVVIFLFLRKVGPFGYVIQENAKESL